MFSNGNCSVPLVASIDGGGNNNGMNGWGDGGWLWIIVVFALLFGWGNNGWGNNGNGGYGAGGAIPYVINTSTGTDSEIQRGFNQQAVVGKLDGITQGICDGFYAMNTSIMNAQSGIQNSLCNGFNNVNTAMLQGFNGVERGFCNLSSQLANCCCDIERGIDGVNYNMAKNTCDLQNTMNNNTRDIIDSQNAGTRAILDFLTQDKIATLQAENQSLKFQASQTAQNAYIAANQDAQTAELIRRLGADCPVNAVVVQPNTPVTFPANCCGQFNGYNNNGCGGCNSGCC